MVCMPMMSVEPIRGENERVAVLFPALPCAQRLVRSLPGAYFASHLKCWTIPIALLPRCLPTLKAAGFSIDPRVDEAHEALKASLAASEAARSVKTFPGPLKDILRPFQATGAAFMASTGRAILADEMGLGKSIQAIAACASFPGPVLILCPSSLKVGWQEEIAKWLPNETVTVVSGPPLKREKLWADGARWHITNYELLLRVEDREAMRKLCIMPGGATFVCDEATRISNFRSQTSCWLRSLKPARRLALTGTPVSNSPDDVFGIADWVRPGWLGMRTEFLSDHAVFASFSGRQRVVSWRNLPLLKEKLAPLVLRRLKEEVAPELPPKTVVDLKIDLSTAEKKVYQAVKNEIVNSLPAGTLGPQIDRRTLSEVAVRILRLRQVTGHTRLVGDGKAGSTKLEALVGVLREAVSGDKKAIIFSQFSTMLALISLRLSEEGIQHSIIEGAVNEKGRAEAVRRLNNDPDCKAILMTEAGAYGLNLQVASTVINYDLPWSVAKALQREDRAHRIGQTLPVTVVNLIARDTIDEHVVRVLRRKSSQSDELLGDPTRRGPTVEDLQEVLGIKF